MRASILILVLAIPSLAHAQSVAEARTWTATPFVNVTFGASGDATSASVGLGGAVGYDLTPNLGFEGEIGHTFDVQGDNDNVDWSLTNFHGNVVYHFDVRRFTPYATAGLGWQSSGVDVDDVAPAEGEETPAIVLEGTDTEVTFNFGGGIKYRISSNMLARADVRRFEANDAAPDYWRLYGGVTIVLRRRNP